MSTNKTTAADAAYEWLGSNSGNHTIDDIAAALPAFKKPTLTKALNALVAEAHIRATEVNGSTTWTADVDSQAPESADNSDAALASETDSGPAPEVLAVALAPDARVLGIAFVLSRATQPMRVADIAAACGQATEVTTGLLVAMHHAGAATTQAGFLLDADAAWSIGDADPASVNVEVPLTVSCPLCGSAASVPGRKGARKRASGTGGRSAGQYEPVRDMALQVQQWLQRHPGTDVTPGMISKSLRTETGHPNPNAYSSGAISNVLHKMVKDGQLRTVPDAPQLTFRTPAVDEGNG